MWYICITSIIDINIKKGEKYFIEKQERDKYLLYKESYLVGSRRINGHKVRECFELVSERRKRIINEL